MSAETVHAGWVDEAVARELPGLGLAWVDAPAPDGARTPDGVRARLRVHVGLDPDVDRTPVEAVVVERLMHGGLRPRGRVEDALLVGALETGVPLWALDADRLGGPLGIRPAAAGERLGEGDLAPAVVGGRLVVADDRGPIAVLLGGVADGHGPGAGTRRLRVFAVHVAGVPQIHVEEALWACTEALAA